MSEVVCRLKPDRVVATLRPARADPEQLAIAALGYIADDADRLSRFLAFSGIAPQAVRQAAEMPGFLLGVLDYVVADDSLVLGVADRFEVRPEAVLHARDALAPRDCE